MNKNTAHILNVEIDNLKPYLGWGWGTLGSDVTLQLVGVFIYFRCRTTHVGAELASRLWYQSIFGKILTHLKKKHFSSSKID